jgi:hypothetical protein
LNVAFRGTCELLASRPFLVQALDACPADRAGRFYCAVPVR